MQFAILGPLEVRADGGKLALGGPRSRALLTVLLLHANEPVSADAVALALWGDDAPAAATKTVHVHVSRLRKALADPDVVATSPAGYCLRVRPDELDAERFQRLAGEGGRALEDGRCAEAGALLREALALWRGPPLADLAFEPFARAEIEALQEQRLAALEARIDADLGAGHDAALVPELQRLVAEHPLREHLHGDLMLALYRGGRQAEALEAYRHARQILVEEFGLEPGSELRELEQAILAQDPGLVAAVEPRARGDPDGGRPRVRIPVPPTPTVGRAGEVTRLCRDLRDPAIRLVTVVGPGGVGKTRLAAEAAIAVGSEFRDGADFVSLAALAEHDHVASTIGRRLEVAVLDADSIEAALVRHLAGHELLLVLDNFEHVLDAAPLVADVLASASGVTVLATSREPLRLRAERILRLDPLPIAADATDGAVALFVDVAQARDDRFELSGANRAAVLEVCRHLDGLPLAIELAASRVGMLSVAELAERLRHGFDALGTGARDAPARQRTLSAALEWSHALLTAEERRAFAEFAVFAGGSTLDAATAVTGASLEVFEALVAKNLLRSHPVDDGSRRLEMLETVREFAGARLAEHPGADALRERHADYYLELAEDAARVLERSGSPAVLARADREVNNVRAVLARHVDRKAAVPALRLATALSVHSRQRERDREAATWLAAALALDGTEVPAGVRAAALEAYAHNLATASTSERGEAAARESLELRRSIGDSAGCARSLCALAVVYVSVHRVDDAYRHAADAERLAREAGDETTRRDALAVMALMAPTVDEALELGDRAAAAHRAAGNERALARLQASLAYTALFHGDYDVALRVSREGRAAADALAEAPIQAYAEGNAGLAELLAGDPARAAEAFSRQLRLTRRFGFERLLFEALNGLAAVAGARERDELAATLAGAADAASPERHDPVIAAALDQRFFAPARARLGAAVWSGAYDAGAALDPETLDRLALAGTPVRSAV